MQAFSLIYFWEWFGVVDGHRVPLRPLLHLGRKLALFAPPAVAGLLCLFAPCGALAGGVREAEARSSSRNSATCVSSSSIRVSAHSS